MIHVKFRLKPYSTPLPVALPLATEGGVKQDSFFFLNFVVKACFGVSSVFSFFLFPSTVPPPHDRTTPPPPSPPPFASVWGPTPELAFRQRRSVPLDSTTQTFWWGAPSERGEGAHESQARRSMTTGGRRWNGRSRRHRQGPFFSHSFLQPPPLALLLLFFSLSFFLAPPPPSPNALAAAMWAKTVELQFLGRTGRSQGGQLYAQVSWPRHGSSASLPTSVSPGLILNKPMPGTARRTAQPRVRWSPSNPRLERPACRLPRLVGECVSPEVWVRDFGGKCRVCFQTFVKLLAWFSAGIPFVRISHLVVSNNFHCLHIPRYPCFLCRITAAVSPIPVTDPYYPRCFWILKS